MLTYDSDTEYMWENSDEGVGSILEILDESFIDASRSELEAVATEIFGYGDLDEIEGFLDDLKSFGNRVIQRAPAILSGAAGGAATGGAAGSVVPGWGTAVGAVIGGLLGAGTGFAKGGKPRAARPRPRPPAQAPRPRPSTPRPAVAPSHSPAPMGVGAPGGRSQRTPTTTNPAAAALIGLLMRPEVIQALLALAAGSHGRKSIPVGESEVPVEVFLTTIRETAEEAEEYHDAESGLSEVTEELLATPPRSQAMALVELFAATPSTDVESEWSESGSWDLLEEIDPDELYPEGLVEEYLEAEFEWDVA